MKFNFFDNNYPLGALANIIIDFFIYDPRGRTIYISILLDIVAVPTGVYCFFKYKVKNDPDFFTRNENVKVEKQDVPTIKEEALPVVLDPDTIANHPISQELDKIIAMVNKLLHSSF